MKQDYILMAYRNIKKKKLRSGLTVLGIFIAVATIFILISLSLGLEESVNEQFRLLGTDKFFIQPKGQLGGPGAGGAVSLEIKDADAAEKIPGVNRVAYYKIGNAQIEFGKKTRYYYSVGYPLEQSDLFIESGDYEADEGKLLDEKGKTGEIMLGYSYKYDAVFEKPVHAGDRIKINEKEFSVRGILKSVGNPSDDKNIYMSLDDFKEVYNSGDKIDFIIVQIKSGENLNDVAEQVKKKLIKTREVTEKTADFTISTPEELLGSFKVVLNVITSFLLAVASISLLVGSIGIANTMYTSVLERTREIGIMKAIGARNSDILYIFLIEAGIVGMIGGMIGVFLGYGVAKAVEFIVVRQLGVGFFMVSTPIYLFAGCILFAFLTGVVSGLWPAWRALKINTVEALRYE